MYHTSHTDTVRVEEKIILAHFGREELEPRHRWTEGGVYYHLPRGGLVAFKPAEAPRAAAGPS